MIHILVKEMCYASSERWKIMPFMSFRIVNAKTDIELKITGSKLWHIYSLRFQ